MSFSLEVRKELNNYKVMNNHCNMAIILSYINNYANISYIYNKIYLYFSFDNFLISKKIFDLLKLKFNFDIEVLIRKNFKKKYYFIYLIYQDDVKKLLLETKILKNDNIMRYEYNCIIEKECCRRTYLRENFLTNGFLSDPSKGYHMEFVYNNYENAKLVYNILKNYNLNVKIIKRKNNFVVYIKESEGIVYILNLIGAHNSLMNLENVRILKDISNNINRKVNCETANISKTINAALKQCDDIKFIFDNKGFGYLTPKLEEVAKLRLMYPDYSLKEIGNILSNPISRSGVNHRLRKITDIADNLRDKILKSN